MADEKLLQGARELLGEDLGRCQDEGASAGRACEEGGAGGHRGLATPYLALEQAVHSGLTHEIVGDCGERLLLSCRECVREIPLPLFEAGGVEDEWLGLGAKQLAGGQRLFLECIEFLKAEAPARGGEGRLALGEVDTR